MIVAMLTFGELYLLVCGTVLPPVILVICVVWGVMSFLTPKASKTLTRASIFHSSLAMIWQPNHLIKLIQCKLMPEGYIITREKRPQRIPVARPVFEYTPLTDELDKKDRDRVLRDNQDLRRIEREAIRVSMFEGCRVPVFAVYSGVALAVNVETMLGLDSEHSFRKLWSGSFGEDYKDDLKKYVLPTMTNGGEPTKTDRVKDLLVRVLLPINPEGIKRHLSKLVDQTTIDGIYEDGKQEGYLEGKGQKNEKLFLYMILAMIGCGIAVMIMIKFA